MFESVDYYKEKCERLEEALKDACNHINILRGGLYEEIPYEYYYFTEKHKVYKNKSAENIIEFLEGQSVAVKVSYKGRESANRYVGQIIRLDSLYVTVSFDVATGKLICAENNFGNNKDSFIAISVNKKDVWSNEMLFSEREYFYEGEKMRGVKVLQFLPPNIAIIRYIDGRIGRVSLEHLKCENTR